MALRRPIAMLVTGIDAAVRAVDTHDLAMS
jgi:hypothetical protein